MKLPISKPNILLPKKEIDPQKWSVIACDQFTSDLDYWNSVFHFVGNSKSSLHLIYPEIFLNNEARKASFQADVSKIHKMMENYLKEDIFTQFDGAIYLERELGKLENNRIRKGLLLNIDLESYDFSIDSKSPIRATEKTILERLPARVHVRENAPLELPHILLLFDDPKNAIFSALELEKGALLYDFELMFNANRVRGYGLDNFKKIEDIFSSFMSEKYARSDNPILFALGDGNHSLASAKTHWENVKKGLSEFEQSTHPARYALVELINLHDISLELFAIHRVLFNPPKDLEDRFFAFLKQYDFELKESLNSFKLITKNGTKTIAIKNINIIDVITLIGEFIDSLSEIKEIKVDYIHEEELLFEIAKNGGVGFHMPKLNKNELFLNVEKYGVLPKKAFSIGHGFEKRFYFEARKIRN
ncbi:MAG: DUF1015 domain-containing protein [Helicobacter sp.]|nr:DUF1015 domain-containing protein [Helicobacter sp.]